MRSFQTSGAPHMPPQITVAKVMLLVLLALLPGVLAYAWFFGPGILIQILLATGFALLFEALSLRMRGRSLKPFINDYSAVVTAVLFALSIPPLAPWWISLIAMLFAIGFAKHLYGGLGLNVFNPAMVGYAVVLISFPQVMTAWLPPLALAENSLGLYDSLLVIFTGQVPLAGGWDAITQATPLDTLKTGVESGRMVSEIRQSPLFGDFGGKGWEWIANWFALGGLFLLYKRVISWQVPVAVIGSVILLSLPFWLADPDGNPLPMQHVFSGALVLAAFFIATDPVSGCVSNKGRLIFGAGVGIITLLIRRWGGYPDGVAFAVLLMNMAAPLIDRYTRPRMYGERVK
ncbi:MAG: electron transport complex subunit RsxD [Gammaproteobacteria bacterium]|nr:MAG: electron transport complex subunit RsxD [Gammaproteobacteria bacterium]